MKSLIHNTPTVFTASFWAENVPMSAASSWLESWVGKM